MSFLSQVSLMMPGKEMRRRQSYAELPLSRKLVMSNAWVLPKLPGVLRDWSWALHRTSSVPLRSTSNESLLFWCSNAVSQGRHQSRQMLHSQSMGAKSLLKKKHCGLWSWNLNKWLWPLEMQQTDVQGNFLALCACSDKVPGLFVFVELRLRPPTLGEDGSVRFAQRVQLESSQETAVFERKDIHYGFTY